MTGKKYYVDGEEGLARMVLVKCFSDFKRAIRAWRMRPCEKTKKEVNRCHEIIMRNRFVPFVSADIEDACKSVYWKEMGGIHAHEEAVRIYIRGKERQTFLKS